MFTKYARLIFITLTLFSLAACGFALRNNADLAFHTMYIQGPQLTIHKDLVKALKVNGIEITKDPKKAEIFLETISERSTQNILSLSGDGTVSEFLLVYTVNYRIRDAGKERWGKVRNIRNQRDFSYDDTQLLAKQYEEARLLDNMKKNTVRTIMRSLVLYKPSKN